MTDRPMLADGCSDEDRLRVRMAVTGESLAQARRSLACYPAPTAAEIQAADRTPYAPVFFGMFAGDVEAGLRRYGQYAWVDQAGSLHSVQDRVGEPGPDGQLVLIAGADWYRGLPLLTLQCTAIAEGDGKGIAVWWTSFGIELGERGWTGSTRGGSTLRWRAELTPDPDDPYAPTAVRVHDGAGWTLFDSVTFAPLGWTVRTRIHPVDLLVISGPTSEAAWPADLDDDTVDQMLAAGGLLAARIPAVTGTVHRGAWPQ